MLPDLHSIPPSTSEFRPEKQELLTSSVDTAVDALVDRLFRPVRAGIESRRDIVSRVARFEAELSQKSDVGLREDADNLRIALRSEGFRHDLVAHSFALIREVASRTVGMRHFDCQLKGGWTLLKGMIAEMETGEGKTLTATLASGTAALAGIPVHVITVNDYLADRDTEWMKPIYGGLGLTVGCIKHGLNPEQRRSAYGCDVTYCTNKEIVFDYLRDMLALGDLVQPLRLQAGHLYSESPVSSLVLRGLFYAIVDEADSVLIDEARTPLIISGKAHAESHRFYEEAIPVAEALKRDIDYLLKEDEREIELTDRGKESIRKLAEALGPMWHGVRRREEVIRQALTALYFFRKDEHYLVRNDSVEIVDEFTGRVMADRFWERGLHQLIEIKEGCKVSEQHETLARISYQRFFRRYIHLSGMTGTAREASGELGSVYGLSVVRIPVNRPMNRIRQRDRIVATLQEKWALIVDRIKCLRDKGRPVLVGTRSVAASEHLSSLLTEEKLEHQVLNAKFDKEEAKIIARAGERNRITIATNMAGRGTDIKLEPGVVECGGLHVLLTERHEAGRIDRQLSGRCGRQGDPGSHEAILSLEDPLLEGDGTGLAGWLTRRLLKQYSGIWHWAAGYAIRRAQKKLERIHARIRRELLNNDKRRTELLSFSGRSE